MKTKIVQAHLDLEIRILYIPKSFSYAIQIFSFPELLLWTISNRINHLGSHGSQFIFTKHINANQYCKGWRCQVWKRLSKRFFSPFLQMGNAAVTDFFLKWNIYQYELCPNKICFVLNARNIKVPNYQMKYKYSDWGGRRHKNRSSASLDQTPGPCLNSLWVKAEIWTRIACRKWCGLKAWGDMSTILSDSNPGGLGCFIVP